MVPSPKTLQRREDQFEEALREKLRKLEDNEQIDLEWVDQNATEARLNQNQAFEIILKMLSGMHTQASRLKRTRRVVLSEGEEEGQPQAEVARNDENDVAIQVRQVNLRRLRRAHISTSEEEEDELPAAEIARDEIIPVFGFEKDDSLEELTFRDTNREEYMKRERVVIGIAQSAIEDGNREIKEQCTVFGFAANSNPSPQEFVGGVRFFKEDTEKAAAVKAIIAHVIKQYEASHQGQHPSEVVIYWNGQTEGEMSKVLDEVINGRLQQAFAQLPRAPQWTFIMTVERQDNIPIFKTDISPEDCPSKQNIPAGVVVDSQLTGPAKQQFFLNSPTTLQGSAATPCYTVLHDELNLSMDALETMTFDLAHLNQICSMTTSLPAPLDVATEYAKRGVCLLQEKVEMNDDAPEDELAISHADTVMADRHVNA